MISSSLCLLFALVFYQSKPNVILIMADDLGYETIGANGGTSYKTPNLDRLAAKGVRFENCFVQPLCTPTRLQLMTGLSNIRNYTTFGHMDRRVTTFGHLFQKGGYKAGIVGKWQLGREVDSPKHFGFDESYLWQHTRRPPRYANPGLEYNGESRDFSNGEYGPDLLYASAEDFLARHAKEPFFLYYPMTLTHAPYQPTPDSEEWNPKATGENVHQAPKHFGDMVAYMDKLVGKLLTKLDELGIRDNTLVIFLGDNGTGRGTTSMMGDKRVVGGKGLTNARGMHVPLIVDWPGQAKAGTVCSDLVDSTDFLPTICEAAGVDIPASLTLDGRSFLPQVKGEHGNPRPWIYSWYSPHGEPAREFAFSAKYKLYNDGRFFDLTVDPDERDSLDVASLTGEAAAAAITLKQAIKAFDGARPKELENAGKGDDKKKNRPKKRPAGT